MDVAPRQGSILLEVEDNRRRIGMHKRSARWVPDITDAAQKYESLRTHGTRPVHLNADHCIQRRGFFPNVPGFQMNAEL